MYDSVHAPGGFRYAIPVASVSLAAAAAWLLNDFSFGTLVPLLVITSALSAALGGIRIGLISAVLSAGLVAAIALREDAPITMGRVQWMWTAALLCFGLLVWALHVAKCRAEDALHERDVRLRLISEQIPATMWSTDDHLRLTSRFGGRTSLFRGSIGTSLPDFFPGAKDDFPPIAAHLRALDGKPSTCEVEFEGRMFEMHVEPLQTPEGDIIGVIGVALDVSERTANEKRLLEATTDAQQARAESERANHAKDQFLAMLSHELRTPLTPALAAAESMERDRSLDDDTRAGLGMIRRNIELEARLIDDLLDLTRVSSGKLKLDRKLCDAHDVIRDAIDICRAEADAKQLQLTVALDAAHHHVNADPARLQQVFWNLLKNAIKFTPAAGRIEVRSFTLPPVHPGNGDEPAIAVEVVDTGLGIDPELLPRVFNAFEQGGASTTLKFGGLGLGLAITRAIVTLHQGRIVAASDGPGRGATFRVELRTTVPATVKERPSGPAAKRGAPARSGRILLVEDHADTREVMARLLRGSGMSVITADNVASALRVINGGDGESLDVLVSDLSLPDGSGLDVVRAVRERLSARRIRAIALSGMGMEDDVRSSEEAGFDRHLTKPVAVDMLFEAIERPD